MEQVYTTYGPGEVIDRDMVCGRTKLLVAGRGFRVWVDAADVIQRTAEAESPLPDDRVDDVNYNNSTTLPYNPEPQVGDEFFGQESSILPGEHEIDADKRTSPADSLTFDERPEPQGPGPSPDLFAKQANPVAALPAVMRGVGIGMMADDLLGGGQDGEQDDNARDGLIQKAIEESPLGIVLGSKYATWMLFDPPDLDNPVERFRRDPEGEIVRVGSIHAAEHDPEMEQYGLLVEADKDLREAAWADVRNKAKRLRAEGNVKVHDIGPDRIYATVKGDNGTYEVRLKKGHEFGGWGRGHSVADWSCSCQWGRWAFKRQYKHVGRLCSHALAVYHEMMSRYLKENPEHFRRRRASVVDDFDAWTEEVGASRDVAAVGEYIHQHPELDSDDIGELFKHVRDEPTRRDVRDYTDPYGGMPDVLYTGPGRSTPELIFPADENEGRRSEFIDVTADDRKTTGPDKIVHFSSTRRYADDASDWKKFQDGGRTVWRGPNNQGYVVEDNRIYPAEFTGRGSQGPEYNRYNINTNRYWTHSNEGGRDVFRQTRDNPFSNIGGEEGFVVENGDAQDVAFRGSGEYGTNQRFDYNRNADGGPDLLKDLVTRHNVFGDAPGGGGGGGNAPGGQATPTPATQTTNTTPAGGGGTGGTGTGGTGGTGGPTGGTGTDGTGGTGGPTGGGGTGGWTPNTDTSPITPGEYTIQWGDTLSSIAERAGLGAENYQQLADLNNISNPDLIYAGDTIRIPGADDAGGTGAGETGAKTSDELWDPDWSFLDVDNNAGDAGSNSGAQTGSPSDVGITPSDNETLTPDNPPTETGVTPTNAPGVTAPPTDAELFSPENTNPALSNPAPPTDTKLSRFLFSDRILTADDDHGDLSSDPAEPGVAGNSADTKQALQPQPDTTDLRNDPSEPGVAGNTALSGGGGGINFDPSMISDIAGPIISGISEIAGPIAQGIGGLLSGFTSGLSGLGLGRLSHLKTADLLERLRELSDEPVSEWFGNMDERNEEIREVVEELRERGFDASQFVANVHEPWHGSGPVPRDWWESSAKYVDEHERPRHVDVTDGEGDIIKYSDEPPQQRAARRMKRTAGRRYSLDEQRALENEEHPLGARNLPTEEDLRGTHYVS